MTGTTKKAARKPTKKRDIPTLKRRAADAVETLRNRYPDAICSLEYASPHELLFAVRLSAQCTDARVNLVTPELFAAFPTLESFADADIAELERIVHPCGFFRSKAKDIKAAARMLVEEHGGRIPDTMEELLKLPGVGRKTANLILGDLYGQPAIVADTHCIRIAGKLGLTDSTDPHKVELQLKELIDPAEGSDFCHRIVLFGRDVCTARSPRCGECPMTCCPQHPAE